jgi:Zn finger protein HypA/HybF involved in hydrogenase expression
MAVGMVLNDIQMKVSMIIPPPFKVFQTLKITVWLLSFVVEPTLEAENVVSASTTAKEEQEKPVQFLEHEIECPRCHDSMLLCSDFDNLYYVCEECDFCLYTIKK